MIGTHRVEYVHHMFIIFDTMIAYHVQITTKVLEYGYALGVKGQYLFLKSVLLHETGTPLSLFDRGCSYIV